MHCSLLTNGFYTLYKAAAGEAPAGALTAPDSCATSGRMEGINNKTKTLRRQAYGFPDDEYFFLKPVDSGRHGYVGNPVSHKLFH